MLILYIAYLTSKFYWEIYEMQMFQKIIITIQFGDLLKNMFIYIQFKDHL